MSDNRVPPSAAPAAKKTEEANALWRLSEWFPGITGSTMEKLRLFHSELLKFNGKLNLISKNTERDADEVHFADCLMAYEAMKKVSFPKQVHDVGSGNGLPGIVYAILDPSREWVLIEVDARKSEFLKHAAHVVGLKNVQVMNVRLETLKAVSIQCAVSRGFASISKACLISNKVFPVGGQFYHLKGNSWSSEIAEIPSQLISVWGPELVGEYSLPVSQARRAVVCTTKKQ
ncbi:MAG: 16S rRNA (guanine(527)-N(7))-methyltransferase RsmG [Bdellovibrionales bacterium]|nr:16S rRNA (guanine(527)-N(7))-methyltransferase RsmG [Bdellovibrionales bacterium]